MREDLCFHIAGLCKQQRIPHWSVNNIYVIKAMLLVIKFQSREAYLHKLSASLGFLVTASISYYMGYASIAHEEKPNGLLTPGL